MYLAEAAGRNCPMIAWTHADHGGRRTLYVFAFDPLGRGRPAAFVPASLGLNGRLLVYDTRSARALRRQPAGSTPVEFTLDRGGTDYLIAVPFGRSDIAFLGDEGKLVSSGRKRIALIADTERELSVTVNFAAGEKSVRLFGYAPSLPRARCQIGTADQVSYDPATGRFEVLISPSAQLREETPGGDPIRQAVVALQVAAVH